MRRIFILTAVVLTSFACGGSDSLSPSSPSNLPGGPQPSSSAGTLNVRITDSPYGGARAVLITFSEVAVLRDGTWTRVPFPDGSAATWTCDLKKLENNAQDLLAAGVSGPREYTMVRLTIDSAKIYLDNASTSATPCARSFPEPAGASFPFRIAAREATVNGSFPVTVGSATTVLVDFSGEDSVDRPGTGEYVLTPVVRLVSVRQ